LSDAKRLSVQGARWGDPSSRRQTRELRRRAGRELLRRRGLQLGNYSGAHNIHPGQEYGYRDSPKRRDDLQRVKVIEKVRAKWKVEWVEPNPGLQDYVKSVQLVVPWGKRRAFLKNEE